MKTVFPERREGYGLILSLLVLSGAMVTTGHAQTTLNVPSGPMCQDVPGAEAEWDAVASDSLGVSVTNWSRHRAKTVAVARTQWFLGVGPKSNFTPFGLENRTVCGRVLKDQRFYSGAVRLVPERDWNLYIRPDPPFADLLATPRPKPCDGKHDKIDDDCIETEVTPHKDLRDMLDLERKFEGETVCVYGVHVHDGGHGNGKPEIHPAEAIWLRESGDRGGGSYRLFAVQDGSRRFDRLDYFNSTLHPSQFTPWVASPLDLQYSIAVALDTQDPLKVRITQSAARGVVPSGRSDEDIEIYMGGQRAALIDVAADATLGLEVKLDRFCRLSSTEAIGFLRLRTSVAGAEHGDPGFRVLEVDIAARDRLVDEINEPEPQAEELDAVPFELGVVSGSLHFGESGNLLADLELRVKASQSGAAPIIFVELDPNGARTVFPVIRTLGPVPSVTVERVPLAPRLGPVVGEGVSIGIVTDADRFVIPLPAAELRLDLDTLSADLGSIDSEAWPSLMELAGAENVGFFPQDVLVQKVDRWQLGLRGYFRPSEESLGDEAADEDLAVELNRLLEPLLSAGDWTQFWERELAPIDWAWRSDSTFILVDPPEDLQGRVDTLDLSVFPGIPRHGWASLSSHAVVANLERADDLLRALGESVIPGSGTRLVEGSDLTVRGTIPDANRRAISVRIFAEEALVDGLLSLAELRRLVTLIQWWDQASRQELP